MKFVESIPAVGKAVPADREIPQAAKRVLAIAHRGDPVAHRENTVPAFLAAAGAGADMVELDVRLTADEEVVILHDPTLQRLWEMDVPLATLTAAEVRKIDRDGYTIPTLDEVLDIVSVPLMVDLPEDAAALPALDKVRAHRALDRCLFVTHELAVLQSIRDAEPKARLGLSWARATIPDADRLRALGIEFFNPAWELLYHYPNLFEQTHEAGFLLSTWTVDSPTNMARLVERGIDALITNRLPELLELLGRLHREEARNEVPR